MTQIDPSTLESLVRRIVLDYLHRPQSVANEYEAIFRSPQALAVREEIVRNSRKLWERHYVDGNGGNLSCRLGEEHVICTPTMFSKGDLTVEDLCLCDLAGNLLYGRHPRSSELLLHLEIYRANPAARAVVHCHPPHATAYAVAGLMPPVGMIPEQEVLVGPAPVAPYETPGTKAFAETILPFVQNHNTVLLANHGVVCWADTVTHAEWCVEVVDTYCRTLILAGQLGVPLKRLDSAKIQELLEVKRRLGLPDPRLESPASSTSPPLDIPNLDGLVRSITNTVLTTLEAA